MCLAAQRAMAAEVSGTVIDVAGKPIKDARVDHTGKQVVVPPSRLGLAPSPDETRTDADGHFRITTDVPAIVIRKPGYTSQRLLITENTTVRITLLDIDAKSRCKQSPPPEVKTQKADDVDYTATWYYVETKKGRKGVLAGTGPFYSWGAPSDSNVWTSAEYTEEMYDNGIIDASGHSADGKYWRSRSYFQAASQYYNVDQETAELLDCVMDRHPPYP
jgi:hypothetical protein